MQYDAIIVGGSFAGLAAAKYLARAPRHVCVLDLGNPGHRLSMLQAISADKRQTSHPNLRKRYESGDGDPPLSGLRNRCGRVCVNDGAARS